jgi:protease-4
MKKKWFGLGCLTSFIIVILVIFLLFNSLSKLGKQKVEVAAGSTLHLRLQGQIMEYNELAETAFAKNVSGGHEIVSKIRTAATDDKINSILLEPSYIAAGYATCNEIIAALDYFQKNGKKVYAYLENAIDTDYYLAAAADHIYMNPSASAGLVLTGFSSNINYYKNLLDKIGVEMKVIHAGQYKGTYENYNRNSMSAALRENLTELISNRYQVTLQNIAENRQIAVTKLNELYENRDYLFINQQQAIDSGLVDQLYSLPELYDHLNITEKRLIDYRQYQNSKQKQSSDQQIAVVYLNGNIMPAAGSFGINSLSLAKLDEILDEVENNSKVKAVVLRINSPGGSALEANLMLNRIKELQKKMPVVVSMANVAASGGYEISASADFIVADKSSITGSIGVVGMIPNFSGLSQKLEINPEVIKKGKFAGFYNPLMEFDPDFIKSMEKSMNDVYIEFKQIVAEGRNIPFTEMENRAQGRVYTAAKALELNLVDEIGNLQTAVEKSADLAGIKSYSTVNYPRKKSMTELVFNNIFDKKLVASIGQSKLEKELSRSIEFYEAIKAEPIQNLMLWKIETPVPHK